MNASAAACDIYSVEGDGTVNIARKWFKGFKFEDNMTLKASPDWDVH